MTRQDLIEQGFDGCIIGISTDRRAVYSLAKMVVWYYEQNKCSAEEAIEFIDYNIIRALPYVENSPIIVDDL